MIYLRHTTLDPRGFRQFLDWFKYVCALVIVQEVMGKASQTGLDYPPMQRRASFNLDA